MIQGRKSWILLTIVYLYLDVSKQHSGTRGLGRYLHNLERSKMYTASFYTSLSLASGAKCSRPNELEGAKL